MQELFDYVDKSFTQAVRKRGVPTLHGCTISVVDSRSKKEPNKTDVLCHWELPLVDYSNEIYPMALYLPMTNKYGEVDKLEFDISMDIQKLSQDEMKELENLFKEKYKLNEV